MADAPIIYLFGYAQTEGDQNIRDALGRLGGLQLLPQVWLFRSSKRLRDEFDVRSVLSPSGVFFSRHPGLFVAELCDDCGFFGRATLASDDAIRALRKG